MVNYQNGKIYRLISGSGKQYVGSTIQSLSKRKYKHKYNWEHGITNKETSYLLFQEDNGVDIILIENYPCENKEELHKRERYWIENIEGGCVNKYIPTRTKKEYKKTFESDKKYYKKHKKEHNERTKKYYKNNKDQILTQQKEYYQNNKEQISEKNKDNYKTNREHRIQYQKKYVEANNDKVKEYKKKYYEINKDKIKNYSIQKIKCECGAEVSRNNISTHKNSKKHLSNIPLNDDA
jgi:hypothetical protein